MDRCPDPAAYAHRPPIGYQLGRASERTDNILDEAARHEADQFACALANRLDDQGDRPSGLVGVGDRQRDALGARSGVDNDELTGLANLSDTPGADFEPVDVRRQADIGQRAERVWQEGRING
jgi:hypothetical protein